MAIIALDRVGDLADRLIACCATSGVAPERVLILDPTDPIWTVPWNPFTAPGEPHTVADQFVDSVKRHSDSWGVEIDNTLRHIVQALVISRQSPLEIGRMFIDSEFRRLITTKVKDPCLRQFLALFEDLSKEQRIQRYAAVHNKVSRFISNPHLRRMLCAHGTIDFRKLLDSPSAIFLVALRKDKLQGGADLLGDLVVQALWNAALSRASVPEQFRSRNTLILDEAQNFAKGCLEEIVAEGRRFRVQLVIAHQSQAQIEPKLRALLRNNVAIRVLFNVGPVDAEDMAVELLPLGKNEAVRSLLLLETGGAYVVRRGQPSTPVLTPNAEPVKFRLVPAFREASMRFHACRNADIELEIAQRWPGLVSEEEENQEYEEVRHVRSPHR